MKPTPPRRNRGFTLIEVLLVLVILVILASLATVNIISAQRSAKVKAATLQVKLFDSLLQHYQLDVGNYPSTAAGLQALQAQPSEVQEQGKWNGPYVMNSVPMDPWNHPYQYACPGQHNANGFDVWTVSPENQEIGNWEAAAK